MLCDSLEVVILGAAAMDTVARLERLPEVDGIALAHSCETFPGGSGGNVAVGIARLGHRVGFVGKLGDDENGRRLLRAFEDEGVGTREIIVEAARPSAACFIAVDARGERMIFALGGAAVIEHVAELRLEYLTHIRALYIGDALVEVAVAAAAAAHAAGAMVFYSPGGIMASAGLDDLQPILDRTDVLLVSRTDARTLLSLDDPHAAALALTRRGPRVVIETLGSEGVLVVTRDHQVPVLPKVPKDDLGQTLHIPAFHVPQVVDATGAGDAFAAGLVAGFLEGLEWSAAARLGCAAAAIKIGYWGARSGLPTKPQVIDLMARP